MRTHRDGLEQVLHFGFVSGRFPVPISADTPSTLFCPHMVLLILGTRWRRVVNLTPRPLYRRRRASCSHWVWGWVGPRAVRMFGEGAYFGWAVQRCWTVNDVKRRGGGLIQNTLLLRPRDVPSPNTQTALEPIQPHIHWLQEAFPQR